MHTRIYTFMRMRTYVQTQMNTSICAQRAQTLTVYRAILSLLEDCCAYFAECDHCVFVIVKAAASSGSHCVQKQPFMSSESRVADCSIRVRQTVCVQQTNSSANSKFTAPGLKFNKTPQRPGPANSTGQHILR